MRKLAPFLLLALLLPLIAAWDFGIEHRHQPLLLGDATGWEHDRATLVQTGTGQVWLELPQLYDGETLGYVEVRYQGGAGHTSNPVGLGIVTPRLDVYHVDRDGKETKLCWGQDDPHQSPAAYEQPHSVYATGCEHAVDPASGRIVARWSGEFTEGWYDGGPADFHLGAKVLSITTVTY